MKAILCEQYGPPEVLQLAEIAKPAPEENEVLVKVHAAAVNPLDFHFMRGTPYPIRLGSGLRRPNLKLRRTGADLAGEVEAVGGKVTQFTAGDAVFGASRGAFAEYVCCAEEKLALKPAGVSFQAAAAVPVAGITALQGLRDKGRIQAGQEVLVDGASGGVGTFAIQIAKSFGAEVTAVCSTGKVEIARSLGADHVIDYKREDFTKNRQRYDLILAANAFHSIFDYRRALSARGILVFAGGGGAAILQALLVGPLLSRMGSRRFCYVGAKITQKDLVALGELLAAGKVLPVIDRRYPLSATAEAVGYLEEGHAGGKVVINIA